MNPKSILIAASSIGVGAAVFQVPPNEIANLRLSVDIAGVVMLGGLIWGLAKMSGSIETLKDVTKDLTEASKEFAKGLIEMGMRIRVLEVRNEERGKQQGA